MKHPSLIFHVHKGESELAKMHTKLELARARILFNNISEEDKNDIKKIIKIYVKNICYKTAYLYAIIRHIKPSVVIETGVFYGASSSFILQALKDNNKGHLYSIDLPNVRYITDKSKIHADILPKGKETGFTVPMEIRNRWILIIGDSKKELPVLVKRLDFIDIFHHDSLHTYEHMYFEFETVYDKLNRGGLLISHDANWNEAFLDFCISKKVQGYIVDGIGFVIKE